ATKRDVIRNAWYIHAHKGTIGAVRRVVEVGGQAVLGRQANHTTPWLTERHGYDPTWDENWPEATKRDVIRNAWYIHAHKGTIGAVRR
ncbi:phage tail protein I, partial [Enterobacter asburiae]